MNNIAVIGAGQIGSRHLQALAALDEKDFKIFVVDPTTDSLRVAKQRFDELKPGNTTIIYTESLDSLPSEIHVAIIATGSMIRKTVAKNLLKHRKIGYLVFEKFLFPDKESYKETALLLKETRTTGFVNCPRRMWDLYIEVKRYMKGPLHFEVAGNRWGLGSNGVHMLDIFSYLVNDEEIQLDGSDLDRLLHESKREGYVEFTGLIKGRTNNGSTFTAISYDEAPSPLTLFLSNSACRIIIKEEGAKASLSVSSLENQWKWEEKIFDVQFQSKLSHLFVNDLTTKNMCELPSYELSSRLHISMLDIFLERMSKTLNKNTEICPIT